MARQVKAVFLECALLKEYCALDQDVLKADYYDVEQVETTAALAPCPLACQPAYARGLVSVLRS